MAVLGSAAIYLAFALSLYAAVAGALAAYRRDRRLIKSAANSCQVCFFIVGLAVVALEVALVSRDFSIAVVADHTSRELPLFFTVTSLWASQPGSLLLWLFVLAGATTLVVRQNRDRNRELMPWVVAILGGLMLFFSGMLAFISPPFAATAGAIPADGLGLDPSLQNPYMVAHPPALYLGYVSFAVPWAFAMAALIAGRSDARWLISVRRWTLVAWAALGVGMLLGAHWAYEEIGWGGYWAWDPVENASLMPWLAGTAFLHSVIVQEKKGMLKIWNVVLVTATFALSIFGTFLTRSGVISSVHSFVQSPVGPFLLGFLAVIVFFSISLLVWRLPTLRSEHRLESVLSREATFLFNNLLLLALAFAVLWGVVFPILSEALRGVRATVSVPYYNFFLVVFGLPLLSLTGVGPLIAWRRASPTSLLKTFRWPLLAAVGCVLILYLLGLAKTIAAATALSLSTFVAASVVSEFARGIAARRAIAGETRRGALVALFSRNRRRYGGYVVHLAVVVLAIGITASGVYATVREATLRPGQSIELAGWRLTYQGLVDSRGPNSTETAARFTVFHAGQAVGQLAPGRRVYPVEGRVTNEVAIRTNWLNGTDIYTILERANGQTVTIKALVNPMVNLIWLAGLIFLVGTAIVVWPDPHEARQIARRYAAVLAREA